MNTPNILTLIRVILAPVFMLLFLVDDLYMRLIALGLFVVAALTDLADGWYARKYGVITGFGKFLDPLADKILVSSALISFVALGYTSAVPVILIVGREFFITGLRLLGASKGVAIPSTALAKFKTFLQMAVVGLVMTYICVLTAMHQSDPGGAAELRLDLDVWASWLIWITAAVTVWTGIDYVMKYLYMIKSVLR